MFTLNNLPLNTKIEITYYDRVTSVGVYGPIYYPWHVCITELLLCDCCEQCKPIAWHKGEGETLDAAMLNALASLNKSEQAIRKVRDRISKERNTWQP